MLPTILERGLLIMQSFLQIGDIFLKRGRLLRETFVQGIDR